MIPADCQPALIKPEDAGAFAERFGWRTVGDRQSAVTLNRVGDSIALFRTNAKCRSNGECSEICAWRGIASEMLRTACSCGYGPSTSRHRACGVPVLDH